MKRKKIRISIGAMAIIAVALVAVAAQPDHSHFNVSGVSNAEWSFHFSFGDCPGGDLEVWGTHNCEKVGKPIFKGYAKACEDYEGIVPLTIEGVTINDVNFDFDWDYPCPNVDHIKLVKPTWNEGQQQWELERIAPWINASVEGGVTIPSIGDPTGEIGKVYIVVGLGELLGYPIELQDEYEIVEGRCEALPGYLIGTTPIVFDPDVGPYENPFSTTPLNGTLYHDGEVTVAQKCVITGCDPPTYENIMVFPTPERFLGSDLNSDGDIDDTVLRYQNLNTGDVINTGLIASGNHRAVDIYENIIAFVGEDSKICYYDINTGTVREIAATGSCLSIHENIIAFASKSTIHYFDLDTQTLVDTEISGNSPSVYQDLIAFHTFTPKPTIWIYDLRTGIATTTGIIGKNPALYETIVAFVTRETSVAEDLNGDADINDWVIRYYNLETTTTTNTGAVGRYPAIYGNRIAFTTSEKAVNCDLNGDGTIMGSVIHFYDLKSGHVVNTRQLGTEPDIYGDTVTFYLKEQWTGRDLNFDGDLSDPIVETYQIAVTEMGVAGPGVVLVLVLLVISGITAYFKR